MHLYLCGVIPLTIQSTTIYPLRNGRYIVIPFCRLSITYDSFIPSTIRQWNSLTPSLRNVESIAKFKTELRKQKDISPVPNHYEIGPRTLNITRTQLQYFASFLNYDLFQVNDLRWLPNDRVLDLKLLTSGNPTLSNELNEIIF